MATENFPEFLTNIDWKLLRKQKSALLTVIYLEHVPHTEELDGIVHLIDAIQDFATDEMGLSTKLVFDLKKRERKAAKSSGIKKPQKVQVSKSRIWICPNCESDNIIKGINNDAMICNDCNCETAPILCSISKKSKVIGFQVVGVDNTKEEGSIHPKMDASFCVYNLTQAREMLNDKESKGNWRLLAVWSGDIESPTMMFKCNPRE